MSSGAWHALWAAVLFGTPWVMRCEMLGTTGWPCTSHRLPCVQQLSMQRESVFCHGCAPAKLAQLVASGTFVSAAVVVDVPAQCDDSCSASQWG